MARKTSTRPRSAAFNALAAIIREHGCFWARHACVDRTIFNSTIDSRRAEKRWRLANRWSVWLPKCEARTAARGRSARPSAICSLAPGYARQHMLSGGPRTVIAPERAPRPQEQRVALRSGVLLTDNTERYLDLQNPPSVVEFGRRGSCFDLSTDLSNLRCHFKILKCHISQGLSLRRS